MNTKRKFDKSSVLSNIFFSITFCFTLCFFSPIDIYLGSQYDFLLGASHFFVPLLAAAFVSAMALMCFLFLINALNRTFFEIILCLLFGFLLSGYVQILFMNSHMTLVTGDATSYTEYNTYNISNLIIYEILMFIPIIFWYAKKEYPKLSFLHIGSGYFIAWLSVIIFLMQLSGTVGLIAQHGLSKDDKTNFMRYLSYGPAMSLSSDKNITVFVTDRMDGEWMDQTLERYPDLYDSLDGFTFYRDNVSNYTNTYPSIAFMLTHAEPEKDEHLRKFLERAWSGTSIPEKLRNNGWKANLSIGRSAYTGYNQIKDNCDNLLSGDFEYKINYTGEKGILPTMMCLSLSKLSPYFLKDAFTAKYYSDFSNYFVLADRELADMVQEGTGIESDLNFYNYLKSNGLRTDSSSPVFTFVHLNCAHDVSKELSDLYDSASDTAADEISTTRGDFVIIEEYIRQLKKLDIYDKTAIIILGDHGRPPNDYDPAPESITTTLMIKPYNEHGRLSTDSIHEMSNSCFPASVLEYADIEHEEYGRTYNDIINDNVHWTRFLTKYYMYEFQNKYSIEGNSRDVENWQIAE